MSLNETTKECVRVYEENGYQYIDEYDEEFGDMGYHLMINHSTGWRVRFYNDGRVDEYRR